MRTLLRRFVFWLLGLEESFGDVVVKLPHGKNQMPLGPRIKLTRIK